MSEKYPKVIFVQLIDEYFQAEQKIEDIDNDGKIAIYELKEVKNRRTKIELV